MLYPTVLRAQPDYQVFTKAAPDDSAIAPRNRTPLTELQQFRSLTYDKSKTEVRVAERLAAQPQFQRLFRFVPSGVTFARFKIRGKQV